MTSGWHGDLWFERDVVLLDGSAGETGRHAHHAHQLMLASSPISVELESSHLRDRRVLIQSNQVHAIVEAPADALSIFAEPAAWTAETLGRLPIEAGQTAQAILPLLRQAPRRNVADARVEAALGSIDASLDGKVAAVELARQVHLSLSQLERLFSAELGISVRQLVRWRRLRLALQIALSGHSLTVAAHDAGFADSAHLSRTMRALFGVRADHTLRGLRLRAMT